MPSDAFFPNKNVENSVCERFNIFKKHRENEQVSTELSPYAWRKGYHLIYVYLNSGYSKNVGLHEVRVTYSSMFLYLSRFRAE